MDLEKKHNFYMRKCLELAKRGGKHVEPNPLVGCVIVKNGKIIGRGWHKIFGGPHAEIEALRSAKDNVKGASLYVNLEPCNHFGKTPPCTDALINAGIKEVFIGMKDPNPNVAGNGMLRLQKAGIQCFSGIMEHECMTLNEKYRINVVEKRPFVIMKIAQTLDGFIAPLTGNSRWITCAESRMKAHELRSQADAILIGAETLRKDNPSLTVRHTEGKNPRRIVLTRSWNLSLRSQLFSDDEVKRTIIVSSHESVKKNFRKVEEFRNEGITVLEYSIGMKEHAFLKPLLNEFYTLGIYSIIVEGGAEIYSMFLKEQVIDRLDIFLAPKLIGKGLNAFSLKALGIDDAQQFLFDHIESIGKDIHLILRSSSSD